MPSSLEIDQVTRIEIGDPVNDDNDDGDAARYHGRAVHPEHVTLVTEDRGNNRFYKPRVSPAGEGLRS